MSKKFVLFMTCIIMLISISGCSKAEEKSSLNTKGTIKQKENTGYQRFEDMGLEVNVKAVGGKYAKNITLSKVENFHDDNEPIYGVLSYGFLSNESIKEYEDIEKLTEDSDEKKEKLHEVFIKIKPLQNITVFRKDKMPSKDKIGVLTECKNNYKIGEVDNYIFYFSYNDYDDSGLSEEGKKIYKSLYGDMNDIKKSIKVFKPVESK